MQYSGEILKVCGVAVLCVAVLMIFGRLANSGIGSAIRIGGLILIFGIFSAILKDNIAALEGISALGEGTSKAFELMVKALGIALSCRFCADICRDCGEGTIASGVESVGKVAIFSLCIPVISEIIGYATQTMGAGG